MGISSHSRRERLCELRRGLLDLLRAPFRQNPLNYRGSRENLAGTSTEVVWLFVSGFKSVGPGLLHIHSPHSQQRGMDVLTCLLGISSLWIPF